jgi:hypothetical protein
MGDRKNCAYRQDGSMISFARVAKQYKPNGSDTWQLYTDYPETHSGNTDRQTENGYECHAALTARAGILSMTFARGDAGIVC